MASGYYYRPGLRYNVAPLLPLVADSQARHLDRANVFFTDGSIRAVAAAAWLDQWLPLCRDWAKGSKRP